MGNLARGFDHIGTLRSRLGDLQGFATLAYELVQNAEDAGADWLAFDVRPDALVVDNGSIFSSCSRLDIRDCGQQPTCDFHRFANIGSGDKRLDPNTIGAFGIGFSERLSGHRPPRTYLGGPALAARRAGVIRRADSYLRRMRGMRERRLAWNAIPASVRRCRDQNAQGDRL